MRIAARRLHLIALFGALALMASSWAAIQARAQQVGGPVEGALHQAFQATTGGLEAAETAQADYNGPPLVVQAVDVGRRSAEPTIGVTTDGAAFYAAANFDSFGGVGARTELLRSTDGGLAWESVQTSLAGLTTFPPANLDPYVFVDTGTDRVFNVDLTGCGTLQYSDDNGETFTPALAACGDSVDHQSLFGGPPGPNAILPQVGYPNTIYYCTNRVLDSRCARSLDGGQTWLTTATPAYPGAFDPAEGGICNGLHGHGIVDPEGRIILPKGHCEFPYVSVSEDGGDTWTRTKVSPDVKSGETILEPFEYAGTYAHTSVASDAAGNLYYVWPGPDRRAYLSVSQDHGVTWGEAINVTPPGVTEVNFPTVAAGEEGRIAVLMVGGFSPEPPGVLGSDPEDEAAQERPWNHYVMASLNALDESPLFVSTTTHPEGDPTHRGDCFGRCGGMFDFLDVIVAPTTGDIWATASDTCAQPECLGSETTLDEDRVGVGIAIRQLSGPRLIGEQEPTEVPTPPTEPPSETPTAPSEAPEDRSCLEPPAGGDEVRRVEGAERIETAVNVSASCFDAADNVVLARSDIHPDALAASGLAAELDAPVLLTPSDGLDQRVAAELERLGATTAYLMGGEAALSDQVREDVEALDITTERIGGTERFETAALIAREIVAEGGAVDKAIVALGARDDDRDAWPDALAASNLAAAARAPIILTTPDEIPDVSAQALEGMLDAGDVVYVAGGTDAVGEAPAQELADSGYEVQRRGGGDRYATAVEITQEAINQGAGIQPVVLATGEVFADALVAGPAARRLGGVLLLVASDDLGDSGATGAFLEANADTIDLVILTGSEETISTEVADQVRAVIADP